MTTKGKTWKIKKPVWNKGLPREQQPRFGKLMSIESRKKISESNKGRIISEKNKQILRNLRKGNKIWLGKKHTNDSKLKMSISASGINSHRWKGGRMISGSGYVKIFLPNHPKAYQNHVLEHRYVMEQYLGRFLSDEEVVHHINEIRSDNRIENLMLFPNKGEHKRFHLKQTRDRLIDLNRENILLKQQIKDIIEKSA